MHIFQHKHKVMLPSRQNKCWQPRLLSIIIFLRENTGGEKLLAVFEGEMQPLDHVSILSSNVAQGRKSLTIARLYRTFVSKTVD